MERPKTGHAVIESVLTHAFYLLVLINPVSKICILSVFARDEPGEEMRGVATRSTGIAYAILLLVAVGGDFVLRRMFHVELYSLRVAGGIVLFVVGYKALSKGMFFEVDSQNRFGDLSIVPLACPMIAGPATITASLSMTAETGVPLFALAAGAALLMNLVLMLLAPAIGAALRRFNVLGALIRITGLVVATIAVQMIFSGVDQWLATHR